MAIEAERTEEQNIRSFSTYDLKPGMTIAENLTSPKNGLLLLAAGKKITDSTIRVMLDHGIRECKIYMTSKEQKLYELNNDVIPTINKWMSAVTKRAISPIKTNGKVLLNVGDVIEAAEQFKSKILVEKIGVKNEQGVRNQLSYQLSEYKISRKSEDSAVRVATFATVLANAYNQTVSKREQMINLEDIAIAGLLYNFGEVCKDDEVRSKLNIPSKLSHYDALTEETAKRAKAEYVEEFVPLYSFLLLSKLEELSESSKASVIKWLVLNSRENRKGTGNLKSQLLTRKEGEKGVSTAAIILSLSALYDETLVANIKDSATLENVQVILGQSVKHGYYDEDISKMLLESIPLYPVGTKVKLGGANGEEKYAFVIKNFSTITDFHKPVVITIEDNQTIDLRKETNITITSIVGSEVQFEEEYKKIADRTEILRGSR